MAENVRAGKRGWNYDPVINGIDLRVDGVTVSKFCGDHPAIYNADSTQLYELGTRLQVDNRVFRYAKAGTAGVNAGWGAFFQITQTMAYEAIHVAGTAGDKTVTITQPSITADEWAGGYIIMGHNSSATMQNRRIVSNTATDGDAHVVVTLDGPLHVALTTSEGIEIIPNIYSNLQTTYNEYSGVAGVPTVTTTTGKYFWVQTWGPCWIIPGGTGTPGSTAFERTLYFVGDGSVNGGVGLVTGATEAHYRQSAGFIIQKDSAGAGGPPFVMLQISP